MLEVGLGGRLDAVNIVDADVAVVTSIGIDHVDYLGSTREAIGREKAGIFRAGRPAICGDADPPASLVAHADAIGAPLWRIGRDYTFMASDLQWRYSGPAGARHALPFPALRGAHQLGNAATALAALDALRDRLPVAANAIRTGLVDVELPGRFHVLPGRPAMVLDVAHNPHAARVLADTLGAMSFHPATLAVFGMLADKDIDGVVAAMRRESISGTLQRCRVRAVRRRRGSSRRCKTPASTRRRFTNSTTSNTHSRRRVPRPATLIESRPSARS